MRLKRKPEDFRVQETLRVGPVRQGPYVLYRIRKVARDGLALRGEVARALGVPPGDVSVPTTKDRRAVAHQHLTVLDRQGLPATFSADGLDGEAIGRAPRHLQPQDVTGNRFRIAVSEIGTSTGHLLRQNLQKVGSIGTLNAFDRQRFASYIPGTGLPGKLLLSRRFEELLLAWLCSPAIGDPDSVRLEKQAARGLWPDFAAIAGATSRSNRRSVLKYLETHPDSFRHAVGLVARDLLAMWLSAYQSDLWNRTIGRALAARAADVRVVELPTGPIAVPLPGTGPRAFGWTVDTVLPLFHHRTRIDDPVLRAAAEAVLAEEGMEWHDLKPRGLEVAWMAKAERRVWVSPREISIGPLLEDPEAPGLQRMEVEMELPSGSYATWILRAAAPDGEAFFSGSRMTGEPDASGGAVLDGDLVEEGDEG